MAAFFAACGGAAMKIVIVEDEVRIREGFFKLLGKLGDEYEIVGEAGNGRQGLEVCRDKKPDLVITDVQMPEMDGLQMLQSIYDEGLDIKAIVLSAYSEFEYARTAMKLGVTEYLLKPLNISDFSTALENIRHQMEEDRRKKPQAVGTLDQVMREIIGGRMTADDEVEKYLRKNYGIIGTQKFIILCDYLGNQYESQWQREQKELSNSLSFYEGINYLILDMEYRKSLIVIVYKYSSATDFERWIQFQLLHKLHGSSAMGFTECAGLSGISTGINDLYPYMDWNISFEKDVLISYPKITQVQTSLCVYPQDLEAGMKTAICSSDFSQEKKLMDEFEEGFHDGRVYDPREIKECFVRFIWSVIEIAKDIGNTKAGDIQQQKLLDSIMNAKLRSELSSVCSDILDMLKAKEEASDSETLTVRRAKSMIHEFYHTGITLDEIADRLGITPEYLGTQFHKETGENFSTYIRNYRIGKAKELLVGTGMKLKEISERVGYSDPKYFSKVFRDVTGRLPAEYRKSLK